MGGWRSILPRRRTRLLVRRNGRPELVVLFQQRHVLRREHQLRGDASAAILPRVQRCLAVGLVGLAAARRQRRPPAEIASVHVEARRAAHHDAVGIEVPEVVEHGVGHPRVDARPDVGVRVRGHRAAHGRGRPAVAALEQIRGGDGLRGDGVDGVAEVLGRKLRAEARAVVDGGAAKGCLVGRQAARAGDAAPHQRGQSLELGDGGRAGRVPGGQELLPRPLLERLQVVGRELQHALAQRRRGQPLDEAREVWIREDDRRRRREAVAVAVGGPALQQGRRRWSVLRVRVRGGDRLRLRLRLRLREAGVARDGRPYVDEFP